MASVLIAGGILTYETIKKSRAKRAQKKATDSTRFSELERDNAARIAQRQAHTCFCQTSDWQGGECDVHGYVPAAGEQGGPPAPGYTEVDDDAGAGGVGAVGEGGRMTSAPAYEDATTTTTAAEGGFRAPPREMYPDYRYRRGEEDGALAEKRGAPRAMSKDEVRRINEERRKRMKAGGFTNWVLRRKGGSGGGDAVVR